MISKGMVGAATLTVADKDEKRLGNW